MITKWNASTLLLAVVAIIMFGCNTKESDSATQTVVLEPQEFKSKLASTSEGILIDVRTPEELVSDGIIEGAINVDFKDAAFMEKINALDKEKPYFVYCLSGKRSADAVVQMEAAGFKNLYTLKDGYRKWTEQGLQTVKP